MCFAGEKVCILIKLKWRLWKEARKKISKKKNYYKVTQLREEKGEMNLLTSSMFRGTKFGRFESLSSCEPLQSFFLHRRCAHRFLHGSLRRLLSLHRSSFTRLGIGVGLSLCGCARCFGCFFGLGCGALVTRPALSGFPLLRVTFF